MFGRKMGQAYHWSTWQELLHPQGHHIRGIGRRGVKKPYALPMTFRSKVPLELCHAFCWTGPVMPRPLSQASHGKAVRLSLNLKRRQDMSLQHGNETPKTPKHPQPQVCGSIIDGQGREIPITEQMIQKACKDLEESRVKKVGKD